MFGIWEIILLILLVFLIAGDIFEENEKSLFF